MGHVEGIPLPNYSISPLKPPLSPSKCKPCMYITNSVVLFCSHSDDNDHYLIPKSKVYTYHYQDSLPRLPIPKLEDTCRRYLDSQKPLLTPDDYEITKKYTEKFKSQEGPGV